MDPPTLIRPAALAATYGIAVSARSTPNPGESLVTAQLSRIRGGSDSGETRGDEGDGKISASLAHQTIGDCQRPGLECGQMSMRPRELRLWQREALEKYEAEKPEDFLVTATPGAGKTTFALTLARRLHEARLVDRVIVVVPTDHLRTQWADAGSGSGLYLDPTLKKIALLRL